MAMMRGATLVAPFEMRVDEFPMPEVDDNAVILKLAGIGICGSNLHWWNGGGSATGLLRYPLPGAGAHEFSGVVVEAGKNVQRVKVGDRVAVDQFESSSCGACQYCASGLFIHCDNRRILSLPGYLEYIKFSEKGLYRIPDGIETHVAAVAEPCACSVAGVRRAGLTGGEKVVVLGAGVLGLCAAGAARAMGAGKVVITAKYDAQAALAERFGADAVVPSGDENVVQRIQAELEGRGADVVIETVGGHAPTWDQSLEMVRPGGKIVVLGLWDELVQLDSWKAILKDVTVIFSLTYGILGKKSDFELTLEWMASRKVPAQDLVTHTMPLSDIAEAFKLAADKSRGAIKVIVRP
jgi:2-desacetyl-2-hydroxyethyl bacteriochlorophyllide A dehydrogenase